MAKIDYLYYRDNFKGSLDLGAFERFSKSAEDIIALIVGDKDGDAVRRAVCIQTEQLYFESCPDGKITRETLGERSISYSASAVPSIRVNGCAVSAEAVAILSAAGLINRWV